MLKSISELGAVLDKTTQKKINGGQIQCPRNHVLICNYYGCYCKDLNQVDPVDVK